MRGGALPAGLLCAALGLLLAFAPRRAIVPALLLLALTAAIVSQLPIKEAWIETVFAGCWASVILIAAALHLPRGIPFWLALALAVDAGLWGGAVVGGEGARDDLLRSLSAVLICVPARWAVARGWSIAVKIVSSWLVAVALLAALLPINATPGYVPDHME